MKIIKFLQNKFITIIITLIILDIAIYLNLSFLRQVLGFLFFTIIPGLLTMYIFRLDKEDLLKKFLLAVGLSLFILMFTGLFVNKLFYVLGITKPLSCLWLCISLNYIVIILSIVAYITNKNSFIIHKLNKKEIVGHVLHYSTLMPIFILLLTILGSYLMNLTNNNVLLLVSLSLIPIYVIIITLSSHKLHEFIYPMTILMFSLSLLFLIGLRSNHLIGSDITAEYYFFQQVFENGYWNPLITTDIFNSCLSISILPTVYQSLLNMDGEHIYKVLYTIIFALTPLGVYLLFKKYLSYLYAFFTSFFFMSQSSFIFLMAEVARQEIALFFFVLAMLVFFDDNINPLKKNSLFLIFVFSIIVSHYSTAYVFFILLLLCWIFQQINVGIFNLKSLNFNILILFFILIFFWYSQATPVTFNYFIYFIRDTVINMGLFFSQEARSPGLITVISGVGTLGLGGGLLERIIIVKGQFIQIVILIGIISLIVNHLRINSFAQNKLIMRLIGRTFDMFNIDLSCNILKVKDKNSFKDLVPIIVACLIIMLTFLILPYVSIGYNTGRLIMQLMVFMSFAFIIGCIIISKYLKNTYRTIFILSLLVFQYVSAVGLLHEIFNQPFSIAINSKGKMYETFFIHDSEVAAGNWLKDNHEGGTTIYGDYTVRNLLSICGVKFTRPFNKIESIEEGNYIYLRYFNLSTGKLYNTLMERENLRDFKYLFTGNKFKIYDNSFAEIYFTK